MNYQSPGRLPRRKPRSYRLIVEGLEKRHLMAGLVGDEFALNSPTESISFSIPIVTEDQTAGMKIESKKGELTEEELDALADHGDSPADEFSDTGEADSRAVDSDRDDSERDDTTGDDTAGDDTASDSENDGDPFSTIDPGLQTSANPSGVEEMAGTTIAASVPDGMEQSLPDDTVQRNGMNFVNGVMNASKGADPGQSIPPSQLPAANAVVTVTESHATWGNIPVQSISGLRPLVSSDVPALSPTLSPASSLSHDAGSFRYFAANESGDAISAGYPRLLGDSVSIETYYAFSLLTAEAVTKTPVGSPGLVQRNNESRQSAGVHTDGTSIMKSSVSHETLTLGPPSPESRRSIDAMEQELQHISLLDQSVKLVGIALDKPFAFACDPADHQASNLGPTIPSLDNPATGNPDLAQSQFVLNFMGICRIESMFFLATFFMQVSDSSKNFERIVCDRHLGRRPC